MQRKSFLFIVLLVLSLVLTFCLCSCNKTANLNLSIEGQQLSWEAVKGASHYKVKCTFPDGSGYSVNISGTTYLSLQTASGDTMYVVSAYSSSGKLLAKSKPLAYHLGKGSSSDPIMVNTAEELASITTGTFTEKFGETKLTVPYHYALGCDIDLHGTEWTPVGSGNNVFGGVFDGNNHTISNFTITKSTTGGWTGFFGKCKNASIYNLNLSDYSLTFTSTSKVSGANSVGGLAGYFENGYIENCHTNGNITVLKNVITTGTSYMYAGGLVGEARTARISRCTSAGNVDVTYSRVYAGGLVGYTKTSDDMVLNCMSSAVVSAYGTGINVTSSATVEARAYAGSLIGYAGYANRIANCFASGQATAKARDGADANYVLAGVMGGSNGSGSTSSIPFINVYYNYDVFPAKPVGNRTSFYTGYNVDALSGTALTSTQSYTGWDFENVWTMGENGAELKRTAVRLPDAFEITVNAQNKGKAYSFTTSPTEDLVASFAFLNYGQTSRYFKGYSLRNMLTSYGVDTSNATSITISSQGNEDVVLSVEGDVFKSTYFVYGDAQKPEADTTYYNEVRLYNAENGEFYGITAEKFTITIQVPAEG